MPNVQSAHFWKNGVQRIVLSREASLEEASLIKKETGLEVELYSRFDVRPTREIVSFRIILLKTQIEEDVPIVVDLNTHLKERMGLE